MKVSPAKIELLEAVRVKQDQQSPAGPSFKDVKNAIESDFQQIEEMLVSGKNIDSRTMLLYQIQIGKIGLKTELISKVGESFLATTRKLQGTGQA